MLKLGIISIIILLFLNNFESKESVQEKELSGNLMIFHAGSLSIPIKEIATEFKKIHPKINILSEASGSVAAARKISELNKHCDVMASADYSVIDKILIPKFADWNIKFASNEMVIVYTNKSRRSSEINMNNWYKIMLDKNIAIGRSNPNFDPCGYRAVLVTKLAEKYYKIPELSKKLIEKDKNNIRPKETDLLALLEANVIDYIFLYRSVAEQHHLKYILLPDEINLKNPAFSQLYSTVSININGTKPGEMVTKKGEPMVYGITIPKNAQNKPAALAFVKFLLTKEKGMAILEKLGQPSVVPSATNSYDKIPDELKSFAEKNNNGI